MDGSRIGSPWTKAASASVSVAALEHRTSGKRAVWNLTHLFLHSAMSTLPPGTKLPVGKWACVAAPNQLDSSP